MSDQMPTNSGPSISREEGEPENNARGGMSEGAEENIVCNKTDQAIISVASNLTTPVKTSFRAKFRPWKWAPYVFISPFFIIFLIFGLGPQLFSIYLSFMRWDPSTGLAGMRWVGLENYLFVLQDDWFRSSLFNTAWIALSSGLAQHFVAIPLAVFINSLLSRWRSAVTGLYFLPYITSTVAVAMVFLSLFSQNFGLVNVALTSLAKWTVAGVHPFFFLPRENTDWRQPNPLRSMISFVVWWRYVGWNCVLYLAALQTIPKDLYEAATIDGASKKQQFWSVTLPMLRPIMFVAVTLTIIGNLQLFEEPFVLAFDQTAGGVRPAARTVAVNMYNTAFVESDFGTASAVAWLIFLLISVLSWTNSKIFGRND